MDDFVTTYRSKLRLACKCVTLHLSFKEILARGYHEHGQMIR